MTDEERRRNVERVLAIAEDMERSVRVDEVLKLLNRPGVYEDCKAFQRVSHDYQALELLKVKQPGLAKVLGVAQSALLVEDALNGGSENHDTQN